MYSHHSPAGNHSVALIVFRIIFQFCSTGPKQNSFTIEYKSVSTGLSPVNCQHIISASVLQDFVTMHLMPQWTSPGSNVTSSRKFS